MRAKETNFLKLVESQFNQYIVPILLKGKQELIPKVLEIRQREFKNMLVDIVGSMKMMPKI